MSKTIYAIGYNGSENIPVGYDIELTVSSTKLQLAHYLITNVAKYCTEHKIKVAWHKPHFSEFCVDYNFYFTNKDDALKFKLGFNIHHYD